MKDFVYRNTKVKMYSKYVNDHIFNTIVRSGTFYEIKLLNAISGLGLRGVYVDVGSNIGNHTVYFALFTKADQVVSIEIHPEIYENLLHNISLNPSAKYYPINVGVGTENEKVSVSVINKSNVGMTHVTKDCGCLEIKKLDDLLDGLGKISLIKIDIEGYELKAIKGALNVINKHKPVLIVECRTETEFDEVNDFLEPISYHTDKVNYAHTPTYIWINMN